MKIKPGEEFVKKTIRKHTETLKTVLKDIDIIILIFALIPLIFNFLIALNLLFPALLSHGFGLSYDEEVCPADLECIRFSQCKLDPNYEALYFPCRMNGEERICCPPSSKLETRHVVQSSVFPKVCGQISLQDRITFGKTAALGQFPWMALLIYRRTYC